MHEKYGFPVVDSKNIFSVLAELGIGVWPRIEEPVPLEMYLKRDLTDEEKQELRFVPKAEVVRLQDPSGIPFTGFRRKGKDGVMVFTLLPEDLLVIVAEFKHGAEVITLMPPGGLLESKGKSPILHVQEEFEQETGIILEKVLSCLPHGIPENARQATHRFHPFLGVPKLPLEMRPQQLEKTEFLKVLLIPLYDWVQLINQGAVQETNAIVCTYFAMVQLGRLNIR